MGHEPETSHIIVRCSINYTNWSVVETVLAASVGVGWGLWGGRGGAFIDHDCVQCHKAMDKNRRPKLKTKQ